MKNKNFFLNNNNNSTRTRRGDNSRVRFENRVTEKQLIEPTTVHAVADELYDSISFTFPRTYRRKQNPRTFENTIYGHARPAV